MKYNNIIFVYVIIYALTGLPELLTLRDSFFHICPLLLFFLFSWYNILVFPVPGRENVSAFCPVLVQIIRESS